MREYGRGVVKSIWSMIVRPRAVLMIEVLMSPRSISIFDCQSSGLNVSAM